MLRVEMLMGNSRGFTADEIDGRGGGGGGVLTGIQEWESRRGVRGFDWRRNDGGREVWGDQLRRGVGRGVLWVSRREEGGGSDGWGPVGSDVRGNAVDGLRKLKEEAPFGKYAKAALAEWAERAHGGLRAKRLGLLGAAPVGPESEKKMISE
jgi:hypothetical protein